MLKKIVIILSAFALVITLTGCRRGAEDENLENAYEVYEELELEPTPEELRAEFETFFEQNKESIIDSVATDGEDVRLELGAGYEFIMTILLDDIELDDENLALYILTFELSFSEMGDLFGRLAREIQEAAEIDYFRLTVIFVDAFETEIARSNFDAGERSAGQLTEEIDD